MSSIDTHHCGSKILEVQATLCTINGSEVKFYSRRCQKCGWFRAVPLKKPRREDSE